MSKALMKKTKAELVDIILRKDAVELKLQEQVKTLTDENEFVKSDRDINKKYYDATKIKNDNLNKENKQLIEDIVKLREQVDSLDDITEEYQSNILHKESLVRLYKTISCLLSFLFGTSIILILKLVL